MPSDDSSSMMCERWQEAISAMVDGEDSGVESRLLDAHLLRCPACRAFRADAEYTRRTLLIQPAEPMPDLSAQVTKAVAVADRSSHWTLVRGLLAVVALEILAFSLRDLVLGDEANVSAHAARHLGAFTAAYGVGLLVVALRPARARTMLPVAGVLAGALVITAVIDLVSGRIPLVGEAQHLPEVLSVVLIWLLAVPSRRRRSWQLGSSSTPSAGLTLVDGERDAG